MTRRAAPPIGNEPPPEDVRPPRALEIRQGDALALLAELPEGSVACIVTSPPYWGLRDYGVAGQFGLEPTLQEYVERMRELGAALWRVLAPDGSLWLNLGDCYNAYNGNAGPGSGPIDGPSERSDQRPKLATGHGLRTKGLKPKDLCGVPRRVAFALQDAGWWLREDVIWSKPNPMPESVTDRCTRAHEYLFHLTRSARYYHDADAIAEPVARVWDASNGGTMGRQNFDEALAGRAPQGENHRGDYPLPRKRQGTDPQDGQRRMVEHVAEARRNGAARGEEFGFIRNRRSVWSIATAPFPEAHFATVPEALVEPCILASSRRGDLVLDPFAGSGTVGAVCKRLDRRFLGLELNPDYCAMARRRIERAPLYQELLPLDAANPIQGGMTPCDPLPEPSF